MKAIHQEIVLIVIPRVLHRTRKGKIYPHWYKFYKKIEGLRLDMQAAIHNEFMYLVNKMLLLPNKQQQRKEDNSSAAASIAYGGR
jgi:hypothetical protein